MARAAEILRTVEPGLLELVARCSIIIGSQFIGVAPKRQHTGTVISSCRSRFVVGDEGWIHDTQVLGVIGIRHLVAGIALDTIGVTGREAGSVCRRRAPGVPAAGTVAADTQGP